MTLSTKALPGEITSFEDFVERALGFDHYTDYSDDHRVYTAGRRRREIMDAYAAENPLADKLWSRLLKETLEGFMAGQLISRVEAVVFNEDKEPAVEKLRDFVIPYLATTGAGTMLGGSVRDAIAKAAEAPPSYAFARREERESMINDYIKNYRRESDVASG